MRQAIAAKEEEDPVIQEVDSKSHEPFPLLSRADGKVVNPFDEGDTKVSSAIVSSSVVDVQPLSSEDHVSVNQTTLGEVTSNMSQSESSITPGEVSSSCSDSVGPSSVPVYGNDPLQQNGYAQAPLSVSPEEDCVPDSTTSASVAESGSLQPSSNGQGIGMSRTSTSNSPRISDTGYSTSGSTSLSEKDSSTFSRPSGYLSGPPSVSSYSHFDVTGFQEWDSSPENPSSVFCPDLSNQFSESGAHQSERSVTDTAPSVHVTALLPTETPRVQNEATPPIFNQASPLQDGLSQLQFNSQMTSTFNNHILNNASSQLAPLDFSESQANGHVQQEHLLGKRQAVQNPHIKNEYEWSDGLQAQITQSCAFQQEHTQPVPQPRFPGYTQPIPQPDNLEQLLVSNGQQHLLQYSQGNHVSDSFAAGDDQLGPIEVKREAPTFSYTQGGQATLQHNFPPQPVPSLPPPLLSSADHHPFPNGGSQATLQHNFSTQPVPSLSSPFLSPAQHHPFPNGTSHASASTQQTQGYLPILTREDLDVLDYIDQVGGNKW